MYPNAKPKMDEQGNMPEVNPIGKTTKLKFKKKKKKAIDEAELIDNASEDRKEKKTVVPKLKVRK